MITDGSGDRFAYLPNRQAESSVFDLRSLFPPGEPIHVAALILASPILGEVLGQEGEEVIILLPLGQELLDFLFLGSGFGQLGLDKNIQSGQGSIFVNTFLQEGHDSLGFFLGFHQYVAGPHLGLRLL